MLKLLRVLTSPITGLSMAFYFLIGIPWKDGRSMAYMKVLALRAHEEYEHDEHEDVR